MAMASETSLDRKIGRASAGEKRKERKKKAGKSRRQSHHRHHVRLIMPIAIVLITMVDFMLALSMFPSSPAPALHMSSVTSSRCGFSTTGRMLDTHFFCCGEPVRECIWSSNCGGVTER